MKICTQIISALTLSVVATLPTGGGVAAGPTTTQHVSPETARQHLERAIDSLQHNESTIRAFIDVDLAAARGQADVVEGLSVPGDGTLRGRVVAVKDNIGVLGFRTTAGSRQLAELPKVATAAGDAPVIQRLRSAGAVIIGTTNMDTWARGVRGFSEVRGQTANPRNPQRNAGGSSAGSAAAVAAGMADVGLGTDTCGSSRYPASATGIYGLKPTWGALSLEGVVPLAPGQDVVGVMAADPALLSDSWRVLSGAALPTLEAPTHRLGVVSGLGTIPSAWRAKAAEAGLELVAVGPAPSPANTNLIELQFPTAKRAYLLWRSGAAPADWLRPDGTVTGSTLAAQRKALAARAALRLRIGAVLDRFNLDALVYPATTSGPVVLGARQPSGNCMLASGSGLPAVVVPGVVTRGDPLPIGVELLGRPGDEDRLIGLARIL